MRGSYFLSASFLVVFAGMTMKPFTIFPPRYSTASAVQLTSSEDTTAQPTTDTHPYAVSVRCPRSISSLCLSDYATQGLETSWIKIIYNDPFQHLGAATGKYCAKKYKEFAPTLQKWLSASWLDKIRSIQVVREEKPATSPTAFLSLATGSIPGCCQILPVSSDWWVVDMDAPFTDHAKNFFAQAPYFEKYGYRYVMEDTAEKETSTETKTGKDTTATFVKPQAPDYLLNPINGVIIESGDEGDNGTHEVKDDPSDETGEDYWYEDEDGSYDENGTYDDEDDTYYEEDAYNEEDDSTYDEEHDVLYEQWNEPYHSYVPEDYTIEYDEYEAENLDGSDVEKSQDGNTDDTPTTKDPNDEATSPPSGSNHLDYQPLRNEADYYSETIEITEEGPLPSDPSGTFDAYWETTNPNIL